MTPFEIKIARKNTTAIIAENPVSLILIPEVKTAQPSGGYKKTDGEPRAEQVMRIIEQGAAVTAPVVRTTDGTQREADFLLLAEWDAAVERGDHWTAIDGRQWTVTDVVRDNRYETRALVVERGR